ncbi:DUF4277 domain-containing protein [Francisellaceae bacterium]|nr:DUF4277 domain-containing protein [Francisellaceae bacterium]
MHPQHYSIKNLDHLGLVSGMCKFLDLSGLIDEHLTKDRSNHITHGQALVAMVLNALGFLSLQLKTYLLLIKNGLSIRKNLTKLTSQKNLKLSLK